MNIHIPEDHILFLCDFETTGLSPEYDYPIELGGLFLDHNLNIIESYNELICWEDILEKELSKLVSEEDLKCIWTGSSVKAFEFHKIDPYDYLSGIEPKDAINKLYRIINGNFENKKIIITSDNAQFEYNFMKKLWTENEHSKFVDFPFHYCAWDTSLLLETTGIGDPKDVPHRALKDVGLLYKHLILAANRINN